MITPVQKRAERTTLKRRRQEIEQQLAQTGLWRGPRRLLRVASTADAEESRVRRLRVVLENLGPVFSAFGLYLSTRVDLFGAPDCLELAGIKDRAEATPFDEVYTRIKRELGDLPEKIYGAFDKEPFESRLLFQSHYARLPGGQAAVVKITHTAAEEQLECDTELLYLFKAALVGEALTEQAFEDAIADFSRALRQQTDLLHEARAFEALALDAEELEIFRVPVVHAELCAPGVLTLERLNGSTLEAIICAASEAEERTRAGATAEYRMELARRLCLTWLRQVFHGRMFPVEPSAKNVLILPDNQIAFTCDAYSSLPFESKRNLWSYMVAAGSDDQEQACSYLLKELRRERKGNGDRELRQRFNQIVPFRDRGWGSDDESDGLAAYLFTHWRLTSRNGYLPQPHLASFYRGLFNVVSLAQRLSPSHDVLLDSLQDMRVIVELEEVREMMGPERLGDQMNKYAAMMMDLPQKLDETLTLMAEGNARLQLRVPADARYDERKNSTTMLMASLLVLVSFVLLAHHFRDVLGAGAEAVKAILFIALAALVLRAATRA